MKNGDPITIDAHSREIRLEVSETELEVRRQAWRAPVSSVEMGVLAKYRRLVGSAATGAVTD